MTRNLGMMAGLLVLAACGEKSGGDAGKPAGGEAVPVVTSGASMVVGPTEIIPDTPCGGDPIGKPLIMVLSKKMLNQLDNKRQIDRNVTRDGKGVPAPTMKDKKLYSTNLDLPANGIAAKEGDYVDIQIKLQSDSAANRDLIFVRMDASATPMKGDDSSGAVMVRKGDETKFCGRSAIARDENTDEETVTFGSLLGKDQESSINIGVLVVNKQGNKKPTPIYIDPNVRNDG